MASRVRSWMTASTSSARGVTACTVAASDAGRGAGGWMRLVRRTRELATVSPRDDGPESDVNATEAQSEGEIAKPGRRQQRKATKRHEAQTMDGDDAHRVRAGRDDRRAV